MNHKIKTPLWSYTLWQVEDYLFDNASQEVGFTLDAPTSGDKFIAWKVSKDYGFTVDPWDVVNTKRYMLEMGYLQELGYFDSHMTYGIKKEYL